MRNKTFDHNVETEWLQDSGVLHNETRRYLSIYFEKKTANKLALEKSKCEMTIELSITKQSGEEKNSVFLAKGMAKFFGREHMTQKMPF